MPEGIYLNANILEPYQMANKMIEIINDKNKYYEMFKWHSYYSFQFSGKDRYSAEICRLCAFLNKSMNQTSTYKYIADWWNEDQPPWPTPEPDNPKSETSHTVQEDTDDPPTEIQFFFTHLLDFVNPILKSVTQYV